MSEVAVASLRELAGSELYRRNAFRVTGLPVEVDRRTARQRQQQLTAALRVGADVDWRGTSATSEDVRAAFDVVLGDPRRRLVHEVFAEWGAPDGCGCPSGVHHDHDAAVRAHAAALEVAPADLLAATASGAVPGQWTAAASGWTRTLRSASFWRHLRHRVERLDDRQLNAGTVDELRAELPMALVRPLLGLAVSAAYPAPLRKNLNEWPVPAGERARLVEEAAEPLYAELESAVRDLHVRLDSGDADEVVTEMRARVLPVLARLDGIAPHGQHRRTATAQDKVAVLLNNCALARNRETGRYEEKVKGWLAKAEKLATDPETQRRVRENLRGFDEADGALNQFRFTVDEIRRTRGRAAAATFLRGVLSQVTDEALGKAIRDMLSDLDAGEPITYQTPSRPVRYRQTAARTGDTRRRLRRVGVVAMVCAVLVLAYAFRHHFDGEPDAQRVDIHQQESDANPPPVTCVGAAEDWRDGDTQVAIVDCAEEHWAEVVDYAEMFILTGYPGDDQVAAWSRYVCLRAVAESGLALDTYTAEALHPDKADEWAVDPFANYATCAARRLDGNRWAGQVAGPPQDRGAVSVPMSLSSRDGIRDNAPANQCVETYQMVGTAVEMVPVVPCGQDHWAQILGYRELRGPLASRDEIEREADAACQREGDRIAAPYVVSALLPDWVTAADRPPVYTACLAHRQDHQPFMGAVG
ncbi:hypothetical protein WEI85_31810 [Actinomycetes bacterium KLBMP 9797]